MKKGSIMPTELTCHCGKSLVVPAELAGRQGRCPACGAIIEIPLPGSTRNAADQTPIDQSQLLTTNPGEPWLPELRSSDYSATPGLPAWEKRAGPLPDEFEAPRPAFKLYSPGHAGLAAFLGGPVGAFLIIAINYWRLGKRQAAWATIVFCVLTAAALIALVFVLPDSKPATAISLPLFLIMWGLAKGLQGRDYDAHLKRNGESASGWAAAGLGVLGAMLFLGVLVVVVVVYDHFETDALGTKVEFPGGDEIYYAKGATEADARALGTHFLVTGFFNGRHPKSVQVTRDADEIVISFVVQKRALKDPLVQEGFRTIAEEASAEAFPGRRVKVQLCDEDFSVKEKLE
jgi:hypothetical protein